MARSTRGDRRAGGSEPERRIVDLGERDWYRIPSWYDILHAAGTAEEVDGLERVAGRYLRTGGRGRTRWLEPACGTGRYLRVIGLRGGEVCGFDRSGPMIEYARGALERRGVRGTLWTDEMDRFTIPGCGDGARVDVAFNLINTVRHLMCDGAMLDHLRRVAAALRPGGVYALGLNVTAYGAETETEDVWIGRRGPCEVTQVVQYLPADRRRRRERVVNHLTAVTPTQERHLDSTYDLRTYSAGQWAALLEASAMEPVAVVDEDGREQGSVRDWQREGVSGYGIWVLRPRG